MWITLLARLTAGELSSRSFLSLFGSPSMYNVTVGERGTKNRQESLRRNKAELIVADQQTEHLRVIPEALVQVTDAAACYHKFLSIGSYAQVDFCTDKGPAVTNDILASRGRVG
jgi:hypothetical protein